MSRNYENPNCAAFFFDDGDFLNLEDVAATAFYPHYAIADFVNVDTEVVSPVETHPLLVIRLKGGTEVQRPRATKKQVKALTDALRIYHSKL